ncbi:MAG: HlyD family secretion protein [Alloprevotella sp.]
MKKNKNKNFTVILIAALVLVGVITVTIVAGLSLPERPEVIEGQVEMTDYRLSSKVPARIREIRVHEGDRVKCGDTLVILEAPELHAKLSQAKAAFAAAQAQSEKVHKGTRSEQVQQAYESWQKARAGLDVAEKTYRRMQRLFESGVMAEQKRDEAQANFDAMAATEKAARSQYDMAVNGSRVEDKTAAGAQMQRARSAISEVESYVEETVLLATADGIVTEIFPELGELVGTGAPIMNVSNTNDTWITFNVREDLLPGLTVGTETEVYLPAFDKRIPVRISRLKDVGTFAVWKATKALDGFDLKTFEVRAVPLRPQDLKDARSGMSAVMER